MNFNKMLEGIKAYTLQYRALQQYTKSAWFECNQMKVYIRAGRYFLQKAGFEQCLVVSNVAVYEMHQGKGLYSTFLNEMASLADQLDLVLVIENVLDPGHHAIYEKRDFKAIDTPDAGISFNPVTFYKCPSSMRHTST